VSIGLKERTFNDAFKGVMLYVNKIDLKNKALVNVFIEDQRTQNVVSTVVAPKGKLLSDPKNLTFHLRLYNGTINQVNLEDRTAHTINFDSYDISMDLKRIIAAARKGPKDEEEMSLTELRQAISSATKKDDQYYLTLMEFHKKFSIPFSCFVLGLLGVPLGAQARSARRSYGVGLGLIFFLLYYLLLSSGWVFGEAGVYPPLIGMWMPNIVMGGIGFYLLIRVANERPISLNFIPYLIKKGISVFKKKAER
jgi:lipopolysaccharide export system permease protein